jgi:hypothetical protein
MATTLQQFIHSMKNHNKHVLFATVFLSAKPGVIFVTSQWFSLGTAVYSTNKTDRQLKYC